MALRYLPMISGQQHHHHGNEKQQPVHLPVAVYSGQEQPQGPECKQTVTTHRYPNRYFPRDDLGNKQLDSDHNRQSPQQPLGSEYPPGNRIASHDPTAVSQKMSPIRISILHTLHKVTTKKWNTEECSNRIDLQRFHLSCRLSPTPPQSLPKPSKDVATLLVRNHTI